ncbi:MAG: DUF1467 family protein [Boseongicola sp.]|nr:MAG: DUF1467 family protein [Boseongicola sp.]
MNVVSAIVLFAVIWFLVMFIVLPIRMETQGDDGKKIRGTPAGAPSSNFSMKRKMRTTTYVSIVLWSVISAIIIWGGIGIRDFDLFHLFNS